MTMRIEYAKGISKGVIADNGKDENKEYVVSTPVSSKWFKSLKSAERFMAKLGYERT